MKLLVLIFSLFSLLAVARSEIVAHQEANLRGGVGGGGAGGEPASNDHDELTTSNIVLDEEELLATSDEDKHHDRDLASNCGGGGPKTYYYKTRVSMGSMSSLNCNNNELAAIGKVIDEGFDEVVTADRTLSPLTLTTTICTTSIPRFQRRSLRYTFNYKYVNWSGGGKCLICNPDNNDRVRYLQSSSSLASLLASSSSSSTGSSMIGTTSVSGSNAYASISATSSSSSNGSSSISSTSSSSSNGTVNAATSASGSNAYASAYATNGINTKFSESSTFRDYKPALVFTLNDYLSRKVQNTFGYTPGHCLFMATIRFDVTLTQSSETIASIAQSC